MYLLDTNTCIFIKNKKPAHVLEKLEKIMHKKVFVSSISLAEFQYGVYNSQHIQKNRISLSEFLAPFELLKFDDGDAEEFGKLRALLKKGGGLIGPYDMLIAAQALAKNLIFVTTKSKEFARIGNLKLEDWK